MRSRRTDHFPRARRLGRGYRRKQVDALLARVEATAQGAFPPVTAAEIRRAGFEMARRGYDTAAVDVALDQLEEAAMARQAVEPSRRGRLDPAAEATFLRDALTAPHMRRAPHVLRLRRGYDVDDVDEFLDRVAETLDGGPPVTLDEVRLAAFRPRRGGYDEVAVDDTLDRVIELLLMRRAAGPGAPERPVDVRGSERPGRQETAPGSH